MGAKQQHFAVDQVNVCCNFTYSKGIDLIKDKRWLFLLLSEGDTQLRTEDSCLATKGQISKPVSIDGEGGWLRRKIAQLSQDKPNSVGS